MLKRIFTAKMFQDGKCFQKSVTFEGDTASVQVQVAWQLETVTGPEFIISICITILPESVSELKSNLQLTETTQAPDVSQ